MGNILSCFSPVLSPSQSGKAQPRQPLLKTNTTKTATFKKCNHDSY